MTKPEEQVKSLLESLGYSVKPHKDKTKNDPSNCVYMQMPIGIYRCDFAWPRDKIVIEVDGDYWHGKRSTSLTATQLLKKVNDTQKEKVLREKDWKLFRITASSLTNKEKLCRYLEYIFNPKRGL